MYCSESDTIAKEELSGFRCRTGGRGGGGPGLDRHLHHARGPKQALDRLRLDHIGARREGGEVPAKLISDRVGDCAGSLWRYPDDGPDDRLVGAGRVGGISLYRTLRACGHRPLDETKPLRYRKATDGEGHAPVNGNGVRIDDDVDRVPENVVVAHRDVDAGVCSSGNEIKGVLHDGQGPVTAHRVTLAYLDVERSSRLRRALAMYGDIEVVIRQPRCLPQGECIIQLLAVAVTGRRLHRLGRADQVDRDDHGELARQLRADIDCFESCASAGIQARDPSEHRIQ